MNENKTIYEVGKMYKVPCVQGNFKGYDHLSIGDWIPVLLPAHEDADLIGIAEKHYHIDFRFMSRLPFAFDFGRVIWENMVNSGSVLEYRRRKCQREMPQNYPHGAPKWFPKLQEKYKCAKMKNNICPHRGVDLTGCGGRTVVCPAHGLIWDRETGGLVEVPGV